MVFDSNPSGIWPVSPMTRTVSPLMKLWALSKVMTLAVPPSLFVPILFIPEVLLTLKDFSEVDSSTNTPSYGELEPSMTILAVYSLVTPPWGIRTLNWSFALAPSLKPSITFSGGTSSFDAPYANKRPVDDNPTVFSTSIGLNSKEDSVRGTSLGG